MTRFLRSILLFPIGKPAPATCSEAGRRGAIARNAKQRAPILAKARQLREQCGMPADPRLGGC